MIDIKIMFMFHYFLNSYAKSGILIKNLHQRVTNSNKVKSVRLKLKQNIEGIS